MDSHEASIDKLPRILEGGRFSLPLYRTTDKAYRQLQGQLVALHPAKPQSRKSWEIINSNVS